MSESSQSVGEYSPDQAQWRGVSLSEPAAKRVSELTKNGQKLRLSIKVSGCTGYAYVLELVDQLELGDLSFESHKMFIHVAVDAMPMLDGTEIDFVSQGLNQTFIYHNPNVKNECGCGESFGVE